MVVPKWQQESARPKRRNFPLLVIALLLLAAVSVKLTFYVNEFVAPKLVGPPLPEVHPYGHGHGQDQGYNPDVDSNGQEIEYHPTNNNNNDDNVDDNDNDHGYNPADSDSNNNGSDHDDDDNDDNDDDLPFMTPPPRPDHQAPRPHRRPVNEWYRYRTESFTSPNITIDRKGETSPGYIFCAPRSLIHRMSAPMILEDDGTLVWRGPTGESTNTKVQTVNGKPHLTYWRDNRDFIIGHEYGDVHILDDSYTEVYRICPKGMGIVSNDNHDYECKLDMHVLFITERGTLLSTAYNVTQVDLSYMNGTAEDWVFDSQFYEIDIETQEILFSWKSMDHLDQLPFAASRLPHNRRPGAASHKSTAYDYFHINAVEPLGDGYLVNSRNMWNVFKVDKTGHIEWILNGEDGGDFSLGPDTYFSWQHDARVINETDDGIYVSMFNNDYSFASKAVNISDALTVFVDLEKRHAVTTRTLIDRGEHIFSLAMGNAQQLPNGGVLVNFGYGGTYKEYNDKDEVVLTGHFGRGSNRSFFSTYNMYKIQNWHGKPKTPPKVFSEYKEEDDKTTVWMSWNGATDYDGWVVYAGMETLKIVKVSDKIERQGFESRLVLDGHYNWVQAEAMLGDTALRNSTASETHIYYDPDAYLDDEAEDAPDGAPLGYLPEPKLGSGKGKGKGKDGKGKSKDKGDKDNNYMAGGLFGGIGIGISGDHDGKGS